MSSGTTGACSAMAARGARATADCESATTIVEERALPDRNVGAHRFHCLSLGDLDEICSGTVYLSVPLLNDIIQVGAGGKLATGTIQVSKTPITVTVRRTDGKPIQAEILHEHQGRTGPAVRAKVFEEPVNCLSLQRISSGHGPLWLAAEAVSRCAHRTARHRASTRQPAGPPPPSSPNRRSRPPRGCGRAWCRAHAAPSRGRRRARDAEESGEPDATPACRQAYGGQHDIPRNITQASTHVGECASSVTRLDGHTRSDRIRKARP